jgi:hypothetical protein
MLWNRLSFVSFRQPFISEEGNCAWSDSPIIGLAKIDTITGQASAKLMDSFAALDISMEPEPGIHFVGFPRHEQDWGNHG